MPSEAAFSLRKRSAGVIVTKIPINSIATSVIGSHEKWLSLRTFSRVVATENRSMVTNTISRRKRIYQGASSAAIDGISAGLINATANSIAER